jgi:iron complex outermembrane receptor protein
VSNELRLSNAEPGKFIDWVVGVSDLNVVVHEFSPGLQLPIYNPGTANQTFSPIAQSQVTELPQGSTDRSSTGVFGQAAIHVTDKVRVTVGIRDSRDVVSKSGIQLNGPPGQCELNNTAARNTIPDDGYESYNKTTWRVGVDYQPTASQLLFANASTGYKPGGFNDPGNFHGAYGAVAYGSEDLTAYELGYKFHDNNLSVTSDLYYYDYSEMQVTAPEIGAANPFQPNVITTPTTLYGFETTLRWLLTPADVVSAGVTLEHSKYNSLEVAQTNGPPNSPPISWAGQPLSLAPGGTLVLGYTHTWLLPDGGTVRGHVGTKYTGAYYIDDINSGNAYPQSPFHRTDVDFTYTTKDERVFVTAFVTNLENKVQETFYQGPGCFQCGGSVGITQQMFFGLRVGVKN